MPDQQPIEGGPDLTIHEPMVSPLTPWERNFIQEMARLRTKRGLSQTDMAKTLRSYGLPFHQQTVQRVEAGDRPIRLNEAFVVAKVLGVRLEEMTEEVPGSTREANYVVRQLRMDIAKQAEYLDEMANDLAEEVMEYALLLSDLAKVGRAEGALSSEQIASVGLLLAAAEPLLEIIEMAEKLYGKMLSFAANEDDADHPKSQLLEDLAGYVFELSGVMSKRGSDDETSS